MKDFFGVDGDEDAFAVFDVIEELSERSKRVYFDSVEGDSVVLHLNLIYTIYNDELHNAHLSSLGFL